MEDVVIARSQGLGAEVEFGVDLDRLRLLFLMRKNPRLASKRRPVSVRICCPEVEVMEKGAASVGSHHRKIALEAL
jgi:hypothetical protein